AFTAAKSPDAGGAFVGPAGGLAALTLDSPCGAGGATDDFLVAAASVAWTTLSGTLTETPLLSPVRSPTARTETTSSSTMSRIDRASSFRPFGSAPTAELHLEVHVGRRGVV